MSSGSEDIIRGPAKVLACLRDGFLTVYWGYGLGMANGGMPTEIPMEIVPFDLRMPNSEFTVLLNRRTGEFVDVERAGT